MKIEIEDIKRIVLEPNEVLMIRISEFSSKSKKAKISGFLEGLNASNHSLKGRVVAMTDDIKLEIVTKK